MRKNMFAVGFVFVSFIAATANGSTIRIDSIEELQLIGYDPAYPSNGSYVLTRDIDASATSSWNGGKGFQPIAGDVDSGTSGFQGDQFYGIFDGQGHRITGLTINRTDEGNIGLFGLLGGQIKNVALVGGQVSGDGNVGALVGTSYGDISQCSSSCDVTVSHASSTANGGGLVGFAGGGGSIFKCYLTCKVQGDVIGDGLGLGGIAGRSDGAISICYALGDVTGSSTGGALFVGGLVGDASGGTISSCYAVGNVSGDTIGSSLSIGGLAGQNPYGTISNSYARGDVTGNSTGPGYIGGLLGANWATVSTCYATGFVMTDEVSANIGGVIGYSEGTSVSRCYWDVQTTGQETSAGLMDSFGKQTSEMKEQVTFRMWDFTSTWAIDAGTNDGYPYLRLISSISEGETPSEGTAPEGEVSEGDPVEGDPVEGEQLEGALPEGEPAEGASPEGESPYVIASFTVDSSSGTAPFMASFTDTSSGNTAISEWVWDFGDETTSTEQNPTHQYDNPGIYSVSLTVNGDGVSDTEVRTNLIRVFEQPQEGEPLDGELPEGSLPEGQTGPYDVVMTIPDRTGLIGEDVLIPVCVESADALSPDGMDVRVQTDLTILDVSSMAVEKTAITGRMSVSWSVAESGLIRFNSIGNTGSLRGKGHLFDIRAKIKTNAADGACGTSSFTKAILADFDGNQLNVDMRDTGQVCVGGSCMQGDLDGNGEVEVLDALKAFRIAVGKESVTDCLMKSGDMNGDGLLDAADVVMLQRKAAGLDLNPIRHGGKAGETDDYVDPMLLSEILNGRESMTVSLPTTIPSAQAGGTVDVPISVSDATGLSGYDIQVSFPQTLEVVGVTNGTVTSKFPMDSNVGNGVLYISMGNQKGISPSETKGYQPGTLAVVRFKIPANAANGETYALRIEKADLKGQFGDSFGWYTRVATVNGDIGALGSAVQEGEATEGEQNTQEGESPSEGETTQTTRGCFSIQ